MPPLLPLTITLYLTLIPLSFPFIHTIDNSFDNINTFQTKPTILNKTHFSCDNNTLIFPITSLNDDYCDCTDGSDETTTNACSNGKFQCKNTNYYPKIISTSKLNDGYCDCCDGSDEFMNPHSNCSNYCVVKSQKEFSSIESDFLTLKQVVNAYKPEESEKYFEYHINFINTYITKLNQQITLYKQRHLLSSYIRYVELRLTEESYNDDNYQDKSGIKLGELKNTFTYVNGLIKENDMYLKENANEIEMYLKFGLFKEINEECLELEYNDYKCDLCSMKLNCRVKENKNKKMKTNRFGTFTKFKNNIAYFENGGKCKNYNINLEASIEFECGVNESFKLIEKENKCFYKFKYYTRLACNNYKINDLYNKVNTILLNSKNTIDD